MIIVQNDKLRELLKDVPEISFNKIPTAFRHVRHQYIPGTLTAGSVRQKTATICSIFSPKKYGIRSIVQYYPLYRYPLFQKLGCGRFRLPRARQMVG